MAKFQKIIPDRFFKLSSEQKQKPLFQPDETCAKKAASATTVAVAVRGGGGNCGAAWPKGEGERERTRAKISFGGPSIPSRNFGLDFTWLDAVRFKSMISRGHEGFGLSFWSQVTNSDYT